MIQMMVAGLLAGVGGFLMWRFFSDFQSPAWKMIVGGLVALSGSTWVLCLLIGLCIGRVGIDSDIAKYEQVRIAVKSARAGDPSYSGILLEALNWNQAIAISRGRINSSWWGLYYSRQIAELELIEMPGSRK